MGTDRLANAENCSFCAAPPTTTVDDVNDVMPACAGCAAEWAADPGFTNESDDWGDLRQGVSRTVHRLLDISDGYQRFAITMGDQIAASPAEIAEAATVIVNHSTDATAVRRAVGYLIALLEITAGEGLDARGDR